MGDSGVADVVRKPSAEVGVTMLLVVADDPAKQLTTAIHAFRA